MNQPYDGEPTSPSQQAGYPSQLKPSGNVPDAWAFSPKASLSVILGGLGAFSTILFFSGTTIYLLLFIPLCIPVTFGLGFAAVILGHASLREIRASGYKLEGRGLAIAVLVMGYATLAIFVAIFL
jgi:hypothetical protein